MSASAAISPDSRRRASPQAAAPHAVRHGSARLEFAAAGGRTRLTSALSHSPLRVLSPNNHGTGAWAYLSSFGGGLLGGDELNVDITAGTKALAYVGTQSATKVFRSKDARVTRQSLRANVADDAMLILLPDPVACFAGARFIQEQHITLQKNGSVALLDWLTSGRHARGERWAAVQCSTSNEVWREETCLMRDRLRLSPGKNAIGMGYFNCFATLILQGPRLASHAQTLLATLKNAPIDPRTRTPFGISPLGDGLILRAAGPDAESVAKFIFPCLEWLADLLGDSPWKRKW